MSDLDEAAKRIGTTLRGKWTLERVLGVGGMAAVYVGAHKIGRKDAIKILHTDIASVPEVRARFEQEAHAVNRFRHPGAVEIRDIDTAEDGSPFLVMELLEGQPLSRLARGQTAVDLQEVLRIADQLLDVLAAAHAQGIVHRDIKPDNLFLLNDGRLKVLDFGIASVKKKASAAVTTRTGIALGTASYMSPEQARGERVDGRSDLFAAGAVMFRLIARRRVHEAESEIDILKLMAKDPAPLLASVAPGTPAEVCAVVDKALAFDKDFRYPDAASMQAEVRGLRRGEPLARPKTAAASAAQLRTEKVEPAAAALLATLRTPPPSQPTSSIPKNKLPVPLWVLLLAGGLAIALLSGMVVFSLVRREQPATDTSPSASIPASAASLLIPSPPPVTVAPSSAPLPPRSPIRRHPTPRSDPKPDNSGVNLGF